MIRILKYLAPLSFFAACYVAFQFDGWICWLPLLYAFGLIPVVELFARPDDRNLSDAEKEMAKKNPWYDFMLYVFVPLQWLFLFFFLESLQHESFSVTDIIGKISAMGLLCGIIGINVAHELGHRSTIHENIFAKMLLATSLYMHFYIEHNKGHHKNVATPEDPSSARKNESIYFFWMRSILFSYLSAWKIANEDCRKNNRKRLSIYNEMLQAHVLQFLLVFMIWIYYGKIITLCFLAAALIGILLLESVNYIEHYGLVRIKRDKGNYERAMPQHSWNSNHPIGRIMLFELSRHSDHHYLASKKYQLLEHHQEAPQLPTGYPGSMLLSLIPPLWFHVMNEKINNNLIQD